MQWSNCERRYGIVAMGFHWAVAVCVIGLLAVGKYMTQESLDLGTKFQLYQLHKSFGALVLVLMIVRVFWRVLDGAPPLPAQMPDWERAGARLSHTALYAIVIVMPLTGWAVVSAASFQIPTLLFNAIPLPHLHQGFLSALVPAEALNGLIPLPLGSEPGQYREFSEANYLDYITKELHWWLGWLIIALVFVHIAAALKHHFVDRDHVLTRMLPGKRS